jgi:hypothetical protein
MHKIPDILIVVRHKDANSTFAHMPPFALLLKNVTTSVHIRTLCPRSGDGGGTDDIGQIDGLAMNDQPAFARA